MMTMRDTTRIRAEVSELQKTTAVLACVHGAAEEEAHADLADAVAVVRATVAAANARIDACLLEDGKAEIEGDGPH